jgi:hypothetical protein
VVAQAAFCSFTSASMRCSNVFRIAYAVLGWIVLPSAAQSPLSMLPSCAVSLHFSQPVHARVYH